MVKDLLVRGMLAGLLAGVLTFGFAEIFGEPMVDRAIAFEEQHSGAEAAGGHDHEMAAAEGQTLAPADAPEEELVSRGVQSTIGLATGVLTYGAAMGGLFALVFAYANGRIGQLSPRATAALLALLGFLVVFLIPAIKYPPNPPAVGDPATIGRRSGLFLLMIALSVAALGIALWARTRLVEGLGAWNGTLLAGGGFLVLILVIQLVMPAIDEVPADFPATVLWRFRTVSIGMQVITWTTLGIAFGILAERRLGSSRGYGRLARAG